MNKMVGEQTLASVEENTGMFTSLEGSVGVESSISNNDGINPSESKEIGYFGGIDPDLPLVIDGGAYAQLLFALTGGRLPSTFRVGASAEFEEMDGYCDFHSLKLPLGKDFGIDYIEVIVPRDMEFHDYGIALMGNKDGRRTLRILLYDVDIRLFER